MNLKKNSKSKKFLLSIIMATILITVLFSLTSCEEPPPHIAQTQFTIARDGICMIVNNSVTNVDSLTLTQIKGIYEGTITNWQQINQNAPNQSIILFAGNLDNGERAFLLEITGFDDSTEITTITNAGTDRKDGSEMVVAISQTAYSIGYAGLGFSNQFGTRKLNISAEGINWSPSSKNIYGEKTSNPRHAYYPLARFLYLSLPSNNPSQDAINFKNWMRATDGAGQSAVVAAGFLKLVPDQYVKVDNTVDVLDLVQVGNGVGQSGAPRWIRADVKADGVIDVLDLVAVGNWVGVNILPFE